MSTVAGNVGPDVLEKKFFDLVVQLPVEPSTSKAPPIPSKPERKFDKRLAKGLIDRYRLIRKKKFPEKEEPKVPPAVDLVGDRIPLQIALTPNPSAVLLQSRILHEVKNAEQTDLLLKKQLNHRRLSDTNCVNGKSPTNDVPTIPQVIQLGLVGVFELIRETANHHHALCCKALQALLHMLEGQNLEGMRNEPTNLLDELFQTLLDLSRFSDETNVLNPEENIGISSELAASEPLLETNKNVSNIPSLACSCLLGLIFAWGNTEKLLVVIASFIADSSSQKGPLFVKIPTTFIELQRSVLAVILEKDHIPTPLHIGLSSKVLFKSWSLDTAHQNIYVLSLQCDSTYLYALFSNSLIMKIGTGYNNTVQGYIYKERIITEVAVTSQSYDDHPKTLLWFDDTLHCLTANGSLCLIRRNDLTVQPLLQFSPGNGVWFCGDSPWCINTFSSTEGSYMLKSYKVEGNELLLKKSFKVSPSKQYMLKLGNSLQYKPVKESRRENESSDIVQVQIGADFSISRTLHGQVYYAGKSEALGIRGKNKKVLTSEILPLPTTNKIIHISVASDGAHGIIISETGEVFFVGSSHRGEDGEPGKSKKPPQKPKLMKCMEGRKVVSGCCNSGTTALITDDGKLYLFGKDASPADSKTGYVSSLYDVNVKQVALGKAHMVVMSDDGRVWTAGINNRGQCGRQEGVVSISQRIAEVELEKDVSMPEEKSIEEMPFSSKIAAIASKDSPIAPICSPNKHIWKMDVCVICAVCCECTGYGPRCINASAEGRYPGMICGCGSGWSGCAECGCCKTCAGEADVLAVKQKDADPPGFPNAEGRPQREESVALINKLTAVLFNQKSSRKNNSSSSDKKGPSNSDLLKEVSLLPLAEIQLPKKSPNGPNIEAIEIACGDHHTVVLTSDREVFVFGKNNHGQLGLGDKNNRNTPTFLSTLKDITHVSCGCHHSLFLSDKRTVYGCGSNTNGQLGQVNSGHNIITVRALEHNLNALWIGASHTMSFIKYSQVLFNDDEFKKAKLFGNSSFIGIIYNPSVSSPSSQAIQKSKLLLIDLQTSKCHYFGDECIDMIENEQACLDCNHNLLWTLNSSNWTVKSYLLCGYDQANTNAMLPFSPRLAIPLRPGSLVTRLQAGLNLLACLNTLVTMKLHQSNGEGKTKLESKSTEEKIEEKTAAQHTVDEYNIISRFKSHGGGWGYSVHSTEAIRFMTDTDVILGGIGVFGGRGEYTAVVAVYEEVGESEMVGNLLVETDKIPYECGFRDKFHVLFDDPVSIAAGTWYTLTCKVSGPSSDCGSHGEHSVVGSDNVKFTFRRSKRSNNGTDVSAGQIPELLYAIPSLMPANEIEVSTKPKIYEPVQNLSRDFFLSLREGVFESLTYVLDWARTSFFLEISKKSSRFEDQDSVATLYEKMVTDTISNLSFVVLVCLRLLREAINQNINKIDSDDSSPAYIPQCIYLIEYILTDGEIDAALNDALVLTCSDRDLVVESLTAIVTECHHVMLECINAFYPTPPLKWTYLCQSIDCYKLASPSKKNHVARLLISLFDSLSQPSVNLVQCLPLFPRTLSNLINATSPSLDPAAPSTSNSPLITDSSSTGFYDVAYSLVEIACFPVQALVKFTMDPSINKESASAKDDDQFTSLLLFPDKRLINSACKLLSTLTSCLAFSASDRTKLLTPMKQEPLLSVISRFSRTSESRPWDTGDGAADGICFDVDTDGVLLCGVGIYGGGKKEYKFELKILAKNMWDDVYPGRGPAWVMAGHVEGSFSENDCDVDHIFVVKLKENILLKKKAPYAIQLMNRGERSYCGENGMPTVKSPDGITFRFLRFDLCRNGTGVNRGQIPTLLYQRQPSSDDEPASPEDKWVGTATTPTTAGCAYQRHALNLLTFVADSAVEIFKSVSINSDVMSTDQEIFHSGDDDILEISSTLKAKSSTEQSLASVDVKSRIRSILSSELVTTLLPELFFHIGVLVQEDPHCAVEVMEIIKSLLHPLISLQQLACHPQRDESKTHKLVIESSHPYKPATVEQYKASFSSSVKWMLVEFCSKSQTGQSEDFLQLYLTQDNVQDESGKDKMYPVLKKMSQDKNWPLEALLLPGREIIFVLETASDYTNSREQKPHLFYGFSCTVTGYECISRAQERDGASLVSELINTAGLASKMLVKAHEELWLNSDNYASENGDNVQDKVEHLRAVERTATMTLEKHSPLFLPGLHLDFFPTAAQALSGNLPLCEESKEKLFLHDFISAIDDTTGGRLARWLQPDSYVDPKQCLLQLNTKSLFHTLPTSVTIITCDQYGKPAYVPTLKVELTVRPHPSPHMEQYGNEVIDLTMNEPSPMFETPYEVTKYRDSRYHAITMMRAYKKYSFEELRISYPFKRTLKTENILVAHTNKETYHATWIPSLATAYTLQVVFDQQLKGPCQLVTVAEAPHGYPKELEKPQELESNLLKFSTKNSRGLRIRSSPSLQSVQIGLLKYNDVIEYSEQLQNNDGVWVKLSKKFAKKYTNEEGAEEAWCIKHHKDNGRTFLVPVNCKVNAFIENDKKPDPKPSSQSVTKKKLQKITGKLQIKELQSKQVFPSRPIENGFMQVKKSKGFQELFSTTDLMSQWKESVPGEYKVARCGKAGHNIRYNPSLKAAPIGKLILGNVFLALGVKRNKGGIWLLLHQMSVSQFCEDPPDQGHAWTLAVSRDGTQHLQLKEIAEPNSKAAFATLQPLLVADSPFKHTPFEQVKEQSLSKLSNFNRAFSNSVSNKSETYAQTSSRSSSISSSSSSSTPKKAEKTTSSAKKEQLLWKTVIERRHKRSPSESDALKMIIRNRADSCLDSNKPKRRGSTSAKEVGRSHSTPGARRSSSNQKSRKVTSQKNIVQQTLNGPGTGKRPSKKCPPEKVIHGGRKTTPNHDDIPFIDEVVDAEGNILSPCQSESKTPTNDQAIPSDQSAKKEITKEEGEALPVEKVKQAKLIQTKNSEKFSSNTIKTKNADKKALSPLVAECSRAVFAAFIWHEGIVHDAMACASFLKFNSINRDQITVHCIPATVKDSAAKRRSSGPSSEDKSMSDTPPATLTYLALFWDKLSEIVTKIAIKNQNLPTSTRLNQNLNRSLSKSAPVKIGKRTEAVANGANDENGLAINIKSYRSKRKALIKNEDYLPAPPVIGRRAMPRHFFSNWHPLQKQDNHDQKERFQEMPCDLCDKVCPYPVTYHMKSAHPGCGKFAGGLGYNSSGHYCGGWAGDCGDGGVGGSTWYLLCVTCREKYLKQKSSSAQSKPTIQKSDSSWISKLHHVLTQPTNAHQVMKSNSLFLLNLVSASNNSSQLFEQKSDSALSKLDPLVDDVEMQDDKIWNQTNLLPSSSYCFCSFPSIPCAYLTVHGKENGINNNVQPHQGKTNRSPKEYRIRSLSNQATPSGGNFKHLFSQRHSVTPDSTPQKTEYNLIQRSGKLIRSVSTGSSTLRRRVCSGGDASLDSNSTGSFLLHNPSPSMKKLMRGKSGNSNNIAKDAVNGSAVLPFVTQRHDLKSLESTLNITLRRASLRVYVLQALTWLLRTVISESSIHDILWYFVSILSGTTTQTNRSGDSSKDASCDVIDDEIEETKSLYEHPVKGISNAGMHSMSPVVEAFHGFLQTVSDIMMDLPPNSPVQLMAIRCWSLKVLPSDHQFLHNSKVFSHISQILSKVESKPTKSKPKLVKVKLNPQIQQYVPISENNQQSDFEFGSVFFLSDLTSKIQLKTSSHPAIMNSLTDNSTETFWESGDEDKNKSKHIIVTFQDMTDDVSKMCLHIDNTRDVQKKVTSLSLFVSNDDDWVKSSVKEITSQFAGWVTFSTSQPINKLKVELRGPDNGLRVRQIKVLGHSKEGRQFIEQIPAHALRAHLCEAEVLKVFKLLTAEVFGQLLSQQPPKEVLQQADDVKVQALTKTAEENVSSKLPPGSSVAVSPSDVDPNLREHMVGILFSRSKLTSLQKKVFEHTVQAIHTETTHIRKTWEANIEIAATNSQGKNESSDTYCFELLSMILALSGSDVGCHYVAQQNLLIEDFVSLLHIGTPRIQRQITILLRRVLSEVTPVQLSSILSARIPQQAKLAYSSIPEDQQESLSSEASPQSSFSVLDPFFACIAKSLLVQVKGVPDSQRLTDCDQQSSSKRVHTLTVQSFFQKRVESGCSTWWMRGPPCDQSTVEELIKLLLDMSANKISPMWSGVTKCSVSESILALTQLSEDERDPSRCMLTTALWQALASLCVLDREHVEKLSSARTNNKNKLCENHDDGTTNAIVQCSFCGNLCSECDRYLHLNKKTRHHQRQIFKEEEEAIQVNLHEGCGRIKLFWLMALADANTLKTIVEFKSRAPGQRKQLTATGVCRFCGSTSDSGQLAVSNVCSDPICKENAANSCSRGHPCGHLCGGVKNEEKCLPCLHPSCNPGLNQDADDMCMVCFTDALSAAPAIQLSCGHIFHFRCCETQLKKQWTGPRITFGFMLCSICKTEIKHPSLENYLKPLRGLIKEVERKALQRLEYEGLSECESIISVGGRFHKDATGFAMSKYAYYMCCKCNKAYYGGEVRCEAEAGGADLFDPQELICGACSDIFCTQICPKHGTDFLEYKCRYCCSVAVYFCFGTTHFCQPCHDDFQRITALPKNELPHCPAGPKARQLDEKECPLHIQHPATGEEFALGCGVCRNAHTF